ncbi:retinol dehydrogenase 11-like [Liolophura sinensis]|uniref:retinol dehydrogenase 11-like n=1 Tax=Liolophura sinensis TaxID=3198878 RepID=UPI003158EA2D
MLPCVYAAVVLASLAGILKIYLKLTTGVCKSTKSLEGKTALVTGASRGIGYQTALALARRKARVIMACLSKRSGESAQASIIRDSGNQHVVLKIVDLSSLRSVRNFADSVIRTENRLDILVNNAGTSGKITALTEDGLDFTYATNYLGPFLMTNLLLDLLQKSSPSRIVCLTSSAHVVGKIDFEKLKVGKSVNSGRVYCDTKLAIILFTRKLAKELAGSGVTVNSVNPGSVKTDLTRKHPIIYTLGYFFFKNPEEGAQTSVYCAVSEEVEGISGKHFADCALSSVSRHACDDHVGERLWSVSRKLVGLEK